MIAKEIELISISRETNPEYFYEGSAFNQMKDSTGFLTAKDFSDIVLQDNAGVVNGTLLALEVEKCTN